MGGSNATGFIYNQYGTLLYGGLFPSGEWTHVAFTIEHDDGVR